MGHRGGLLGGSRRRRAGLVVLAAVVGVGLGLLVTGAGGDDDTSPPRLSKIEAVDAPPTTAPRSGPDLAEAVEVLDTGLTTGEHQYCAMGSDPDPSDGCERGTLTTSYEVTYGVVVRNNSDQLLKGILVAVDVVDAQGQPMTMGYGRERLISRLLPGEELGFGDVATLDRAGATRLEVAVQPPASWSSVEFAQARGERALLLQADMREADMSGYGAIGPGGVPMDWTISYFGDVSFPEGTAGRPSAGTTFATATVVLRDESRRIVGGATAPAAEILGAGVQGEIEIDATHLPLPFVEVTVDDVYVSDFRIG